MLRFAIKQSRRTYPAVCLFCKLLKNEEAQPNDCAVLSEICALSDKVQHEGEDDENYRKPLGGLCKLCVE